MGQETVRMETSDAISSYNDAGGVGANDFKYKFQLKPIYEIAYVRPNPPAAIAGLQKGDVIITINYNPIYKKLTRDQRSFRSEEERTLEVERKSEILKFNFQLYNILKKCFW
jgi:C-terminal processing protease CtpA/Prc